MAKIHSKQKDRRLSITRPHKKGAKTFSTEERAKEYAKENQITNFELKKVKKDKRFQIISLN